MTGLVWPVNQLVPKSISVQPVGQSRGGGAGALGNEQVVRGPAMRWSIKYTDVPVRMPSLVRLWRAIEGQLDGRAGTIVVPIYDWTQAPNARTGIGATLAADAALNATVLAVGWTLGPAPVAGQYFSLGPYLHRIVDLTATGASAANLTIRPWLRAAAVAGGVLEFADPVCRCRLASDDAMSLELEHGRRGHPNVAFTEAF